jgi:hypothetical protein
VRARVASGGQAANGWMNEKVGGMNHISISLIIWVAAGAGGLLLIILLCILCRSSNYRKHGELSAPLLEDNLGGPSVSIEMKQSAQKSGNQPNQAKVVFAPPPCRKKQQGSESDSDDDGPELTQDYSHGKLGVVSSFFSLSPITSGVFLSTL